MTRTEITRALLLNAARREFTAHGISGARVDRIAQQAGVNKQRIYAYFGNKEQLFQHVVENALHELAQVVSLRGTSPAEYVRHVHEYHRDHPDLLRLLLWESLHYDDRRLPSEDERAPLYADKVQTLAESMGEPPSEHTKRVLLTLIGIAAYGVWTSGSRAVAETMLTVFALHYAVTWPRTAWLPKNALAAESGVAPRPAVSTICASCCGLCAATAWRLLSVFHPTGKVI